MSYLRIRDKISVPTLGASAKCGAAFRPASAEHHHRKRRTNVCALLTKRRPEANSQLPRARGECQSLLFTASGRGEPSDLPVVDGSAAF